MSKRKPFNGNAGYIASRLYQGAYIVIYKAEEAGVDVGENKYAIVCEAHSCMVGTTSVPNAREIMKYPEFCERCCPAEDEEEINFAAAAQEATYIPEPRRWYQCDEE